MIVDRVRPARRVDRIGNASHVGRRAAVAGLMVLVAACGGSPDPLPEGVGDMSFFVTSRNIGAGGNLGGLAGADAHCRTLAEAAGSSIAEWRAYLSAGSGEGAGPVHAKDRIGPGPWFNVRGVEVAASVEDLHGEGNHLGPATSLTETGEPLGSRMHDILTGSNPDGTWAGAGATCADWTSRATSDLAMLGHHDRRGGGVRPQSWNAAHMSAGCSPAALESTGSDARFYCFASSTPPASASRPASASAAPR